MMNKGVMLSTSRIKSLPWGAIILASIQMIDFPLTYWGINVLGVIREANPFMVFMFEINFPLALFIRTVSVTLIFWLIIEIRNRCRKRYRDAVVIGLICNMIVMYLHYIWISFFYFS